MSTPFHDMDPAREAQINALLDGELNDTDRVALERAAENDPALADALAAALELHKLLGSMPRVKAPGRVSTYPGNHRPGTRYRAVQACHGKHGDSAVAAAIETRGV